LKNEPPTFHDEQLDELKTDAKRNTGALKAQKEESVALQGPKSGSLVLDIKRVWAYLPGVD
jgi:hypothetical protein